MGETVAKVVITVLGVHALLKFLFFFALPYTTRRKALDRAYGSKPSATSTSDAVVLTIAIAVAAFLFWRGIEPVSLLGGFWVGATLTQLFFHRFHEPVPSERAAPPEVSPLKMMSYAIQDKPALAWREMGLMAIFILATLYTLYKR